MTDADLIAKLRESQRGKLQQFDPLMLQAADVLEARNAEVVALREVIETAMLALSLPYSGQKWDSELNRRPDWDIRAFDARRTLASVPVVSETTTEDQK